MSIKSTIAAVAASPFLLAGAAFAGPYVNVESNLTYPDGDYSSAATDLHIGYEGSTEDGKIAYYVQGGPAFNHTESTDDTETELSGITDEASNGDDEIDWGAKIGAKFTF